MLITKSTLAKFKMVKHQNPLDTSDSTSEAPVEEDHPRIPKLQSLKIDPRVKDCHRFQPNPKYSCNKDVLRTIGAGKWTNWNQKLYSKMFKHNNTCNLNTKIRREYTTCMTYCVVSVCLAFVLGLAIGVFLMGPSERAIQNLLPRQAERTYTLLQRSNSSQGTFRTLNSIKEKAFNKITGPNDIDEIKGLNEGKGTFSSVSFTEASLKHTEPHVQNNREIYPKGMTEDMKDILKDNKNNRRHDIKIILNVENKTDIPNDQTILFDNVYWGPHIENALPQGYDETSTSNWENYVKHTEAVKMESGCGRMQNRLVTFGDGLQACVRYRQNTDQIQGEIFSFYVARLLNLTNLAPSMISVVDLKDKLWQNVASDIATAQWNSNRAVVLTQYIPSLESATIPEAFKPSERHLNKFDVLKMSLQDNDTLVKTVLIDRLKKYQNTGKVNEKNNKTEYFEHIEMNLGEKTLKSFIELAQWSDLIIFDYLTANLDRIVNNLFNFQWNVNIMDGPAHNLARKLESGLLMFLDNESGLLHGYRLLKKYNVYHSLMLDNLCVFRKSTIDALKTLYDNQSVGEKISEMFRKKNNPVIRDILPPLPEKNVKILYDRIGKVLNQVQKCEQSFSKR